VNEVQYQIKAFVRGEIKRRNQDTNLFVFLPPHRNYKRKRGNT